MSTQPFTGKLGATLISLAALAVIAAACKSDGGGDGDSDAATVTPVIVSSELALGENRFMIGLLSGENEQITDAEITYRFFKLEGEEGVLRMEAQATPVVLQKSYTHTHEDGTVETHEAGESGVYVATVQFDEGGLWGAEVTAIVGDTKYDPMGLQFTVLEESSSVAIGAPAPRSVQTILSDVDDIKEIDTSDPPNPGTHAITIAEAVTSGKPTVIVFATPAFCVFQICGPVNDIVAQLFQKYGAQANFIHVEPYFLKEARENVGLCLVPIFNLQAAREKSGGPDCPALTEDELPPPDQSWNLESEPWVFLVDGEGNVAAKFEAFVSEDELEQALTPLLDGGGTSSGTRY